MIRVIDAYHLQVGDRTWWGEYYASDMVTDDVDMHVRQFIVWSESGWSASIIWGNASYSDNHDYSMIPGSNDPFVEQPETVELAFFHKDRDGIQPDGSPMGYLDEDDLNFTLDQMMQAGTTDHLIVRGHIALFLRSQADVPSGK